MPRPPSRIPLPADGIDELIDLIIAGVFFLGLLLALVSAGGALLQAVGLLY